MLALVDFITFYLAYPTTEDLFGQPCYSAILFVLFGHPFCVHRRMDSILAVQKSLDRAVLLPRALVSPPSLCRQRPPRNLRFFSVL